jgi:hypothetical protein
MSKTDNTLLKCAKCRLFSVQKWGRCLLVPDGKGQGQLAFQKEWKKCEEENK